MQGLMLKNGVEPYFDVPVSLMTLLPKTVVPSSDLKRSMHANLLSKLCARAFKPYLLSRGWLNSRRFIDSHYRYHIEYVPDFSVDTAVVEPGRVVNLQVIALGLKDLLEQFEPAYYPSKGQQAFATRLSQALLAKLDALLRRME